VGQMVGRAAGFGAWRLRIPGARHRAGCRGGVHPRLHLVPPSTPPDTCRAGQNRYLARPLRGRKLRYDGMEGSVELSGTGRR
jgi:hypothetical protein